MQLVVNISTFTSGADLLLYANDEQPMKMYSMTWGTGLTTALRISTVDEDALLTLWLLARSDQALHETVQLQQARNGKILLLHHAQIHTAVSQKVTHVLSVLQCAFKHKTNDSPARQLQWDRSDRADAQS